MKTVKRVVRKMKGGFRAVSKGLAFTSLDRITSHSGVGDSAYLLYGLVRSAKPKVVVEIGSARGRSSCFIGMALKANGQGKLYAIDPHTRTAWNDVDSVDTYGILVNNVRKLGIENYVEVVRDLSDRVADGWNRQIDILFIDGDHSYEGVKRDWSLFSPFVQPFGVVIFHDTLWSIRPVAEYQREDMGVPRFVDELRAAGYPVITLDRDYGVSIVQPVLKGVVLQRDEEEQLVSGVAE